MGVPRSWHLIFSLFCIARIWESRDHGTLYFLAFLCCAHMGVPRSQHPIVFGFFVFRAYGSPTIMAYYHMIFITVDTLGRWRQEVGEDRERWEGECWERELLGDRVWETEQELFLFARGRGGGRRRLLFLCTMHMGVPHHSTLIFLASAAATAVIIHCCCHHHCIHKNYTNTTINKSHDDG